MKARIVTAVETLLSACGVCVIPGGQWLEQRRASEESPGQAWILTAPLGFTGDLQSTQKVIK